MIRFVIFFILIKSSLFACSLCSIYSPKTFIEITLNADNEYIKTASFKWTFDKAFSDELLQLYDKNLDASFDKKELLPIENSLINYIEAKNYLTFLSYAKTIEKKSRLVNVRNEKLRFQNSVLFFEYTLDLNYKLIHKNKLFIKIHDEESYFNIFYNENKQIFEIPYPVKKEISQNSITYILDMPNDTAINLNKNSTPILNSIEEENLIKIEEKQESTNLLASFSKKIKEYLLVLEKGEDNYAIIFLLFVSFVYGIIHALGPGHGKALAFAYFSAKKSSISEALVISFFTAFIHIVGAFILVSISIFIIEGIFSSFLDDSISYISKTSAILIMILSIYILYRKLKNKSCSCCNITDSSKMIFSITTEESYILRNRNRIKHNSNRKKENLYFVLTAGLIPCPGTVILFVYAFILETYFWVFLASVFISLGMALIIFISSFIGLSLNNVAKKSSKMINILEIFSPIFMFLLGLFLLLNFQVI